MNSKHIYKVLNMFGLSDTEIQIYLEVLKNSASPNELSKTTGIARSTVYNIIDDLVKVGLVKVNDKTGQTEVIAENPEVFRTILRHQRRDSVNLENQINFILPELKGEINLESNASVKYLSGTTGAAEVYFNTDVEHPECTLFNWTKLLPLDALGNENVTKSARKLEKRRQKMHKKMKILVPLNDWTRHVISYQASLDPDYLRVRDIRFIDDSGFNAYLDLVISGDNVKITCAEGNELWGMLMNSAALAKTFISMFELNWQSATPVTNDHIELWGRDGIMFTSRKPRGQ